MSRRIARLLDQPERLVAKTIMSLEHKNGYPSHDARHIAHNIQLLRAKLSDLDMDPDDTTAQELYHALLAKYEKDCLAFDVEQGFHALDLESKVKTAAEIMSANMTMPQRWALKTTAAKNLLRGHPPKKLMKLLSYRSVESMLKRENNGKLLIMAEETESEAWRKQLGREISKLDSTAFEIRDISIVYLGYAGSGDPLVFSSEAGVLGVRAVEAAEKMRLLGLSVTLADFLGSLNNEDVKIKSPALEWWHETDGLLADLDGGIESLSCKDAALNHALENTHQDRSLSAGRTKYWRNLLSRYQNQLEIEEDMLSDAAGLVFLQKTPIRQPIFEYAEDF